jgi:hypothetical protein
MKAPVLSSTGRALLDRRTFLQQFGHGAAGIALATLLSRDRALGASAVRPMIDSGRPLAPRAPHFAAKAKRLLMIQCSGGVIHLDSFDWKPELLRMDGKPMPDAKENFVTFQGENGNLVRPLYEFKPRGRSGKMLSDLFPRIAEMADDLCFIHSMTAKSNTHGPADCQMNTGLIFDGYPSVGA